MWEKGQVGWPISLRDAYATCSTVIAYAATCCAVLSWHAVLGDVRYCDSVCCYAMCGTEIAYGARAVSYTHLTLPTICSV
eukprot:1843261-Rhodomonas_salina.1